MMYNIWYHKKVGIQERKKRHEVHDVEVSKLPRCNPRRDSGWTRGSQLADTHICLHFARGECSLGSECRHLHRVPCQEDFECQETMYDCFGRKRHRDDKEDMGGVGSFLRDNVALYLGNLYNIRGGVKHVYKLVAEQFGVYGPIDSIRVLPDKPVAFVHYRWRCSAEFAKEAMIDQVLGDGHDTSLNVRWAATDPNPAAQRRHQQLAERRAVQLIVAQQPHLLDKPKAKEKEEHMQTTQKEMDETATEKGEHMQATQIDETAKKDKETQVISDNDSDDTDDSDSDFNSSSLSLQLVPY
jgi:pre-mRNA-splicing factor CWC2